jgi:outer membrane lipoprotein-sorting protein
MGQTVRELARQAMSAYDALESFEATQKISAGPIQAEARIRFKKPDKITVEYRSYQNPVSELEERFTGGAEFVADELVGMQLICDGQGTWLYHAKNDVALHKLGRTLYSPLPWTSTLAEVGFLRDLTRDFLLRDEGEETIAGRSARRLGLKPKSQHRSFLLKEEIFPMKKATLTLDEQMAFPLRISYKPISSSALSLLVGPSTLVTVEYSDVVLDKVDENRFSFVPPDDARVFREELVSKDAFEDALPFSVPLSVFEESGDYALHGERAAAVLNEGRDRGYATFTFVSVEDPDAQDDERMRNTLTVRVGNYLSRNMSRRRAMLSEKGESTSLGDVAAKFLDRGALVKEQLPETSTRSMTELGWDKEGVYWFLLAEGVEKDALVELAKALIHAEST